MGILYWIFYLVCVMYCMWRMNKSYKKRSLDGVIGVSPGFDTLIIILFAPLFTIVDLILTWIRLVKESN